MCRARKLAWYALSEALDILKPQLLHLCKLHTVEKDIQPVSFREAGKWEKLPSESNRQQMQEGYGAVNTVWTTNCAGPLPVASKRSLGTDTGLPLMLGRALDIFIR